MQEAYEQARADLSERPDDPWAQRGMGWVLYYLIKQDVADGHFEPLTAHVEELKALEQLSMESDSMIFENVAFQIGLFAKRQLSPNDADTPARLSLLFALMRDYSFGRSKGYSMLIDGMIRHVNWPELSDFIDWWGLEHLSKDDYTPYHTDGGRVLMSLAERVYIAKSKVLLMMNDREQTEAFLPLLDSLTTNHPEMTYPGYFYGKLLNSLGSTSAESLKVIMPFARKKRTEFWVWQLLADTLSDDREKQMACLLRAVNSKTKEQFLGKVRIKLALLCVESNLLSLAKYQIDKVVRCYLKNGWRLPYEIEYWTHQPWINTVKADDKSPIDYMKITDGILCEGTEEAVAVVVHYDFASKKSHLIYGIKKKTTQRLPIRVEDGDVLKIRYTVEGDKFNILKAEKTTLTTGIKYAKESEGTISKREIHPFAFLNAGTTQAFVAPGVVKKYNLKDGDKVKALLVYDYNSKRGTWSWNCIGINQE